MLIKRKLGKKVGKPKSTDALIRMTATFEEIFCIRLFEYPSRRLDIRLVHHSANIISEQMPPRSKKPKISKSFKNQWTKFQAQFALDLIKNAEPFSTAFLSPSSITVALAMLYAESNGNTKLQMNKVIFGGAPDDEIERHFEAYLAELSSEDNPGYQMRSGNRLYVPVNIVLFSLLVRFDLQQNKVEQAKVSNEISYKGAFRSVDFANETTAVVQEINEWVDSLTNSQIHKVLENDHDLNASTQMVLINAVYFHGFWAKPFDPTLVSQKPFHSSITETRLVEMMSSEPNTFLCAEHAGFKVLKLEYNGRKVAIYFLLPIEQFRLDKLETKLDGSGLLQLMHLPVNQIVKVEIPKFQLDHTYNLIPTLRKLGVEDAFSTDADFSKITGHAGTCFTHIVHKVCLDVNEGGHGGTSTTRQTRSNRDAKEPAHFVADHPFLFVIAHDDDILFLGRYC